MLPAPWSAPLPGTTAVNGVNSRGAFVGIYVDTGYLRDGFLNQESTVQPVSVSGATEVLPFGMNDKGVIVGGASENGSTHGFVTAGSVTGGDNDREDGDDQDGGDQGGEGK